MAVQHFAYEFTNVDLPIIDVDCGTGLVGQELAKAGYTVIDGVDISDKMLAHAKETGVCRHLISKNVERLGHRLQSQYKTLICVGGFGIGHLGPSVLYH
ncbi:MAG: methyltransferase domain-containing protein [Rhodobacterales bacterium]